MNDKFSALPVGYLFFGYRVEGILGRGGFGVTYLAMDSMQNCRVAIKEYYPREFAERDGKYRVYAVGTHEDFDTFEWGLARFLDEARTLARFDHPSIVPVRRFFEENGTAYLVMDYCDGESLAELVKRDGPLTNKQLSNILFPLLESLEVIHATGTLHCDIKPSNIFIRNDGSPVLIDFGSARQDMAEHSNSVTSLATPGYSAFEQYSTHDQQGPWTDIYGLGATLYYALTTQKPQDAPSRILQDLLEPIRRKVSGDYPDKLLSAIDTALAVRPEDRPQNIQEWRSLLWQINLQMLLQGIKSTLKLNSKLIGVGSVALSGVIVVSLIFLYGARVKELAVSKLLDGATISKTTKEVVPDVAPVVAPTRIPTNNLPDVASGNIIRPSTSSKQEALFDQAETAYLRKDYVKAEELFCQVAEQGHVRSQVILGRLYKTGAGVSKNDQSAVYWFHKAAEHGDAGAQNDLGWLCSMGRGVSKDNQKAVYWYQKAAEQGLAEAQFNLGLMYAGGIGVTQDNTTAKYWYRKAAEQGDMDAEATLRNLQE